VIKSIFKTFTVQKFYKMATYQYLCGAIIKKDGGNWSCDVLATHSPEAGKGATSIPGKKPGGDNGRFVY
jgi:hypothetical protein